MHITAFPEGGRGRGGAPAPAWCRHWSPASDASGHEEGHDSSMALSVSSLDLPPSQSPILVQKVPEPTSAGIRSEPSNRNTSASAADWAMARVVSSPYW